MRNNVGWMPIELRQWCKLPIQLQSRIFHLLRVVSKVKDLGTKKSHFDIVMTKNKMYVTAVSQLMVLEKLKELLTLIWMLFRFLVFPMLTNQIDSNIRLWKNH